ncbi:MAG: hypothetical protein ACI91F_003529 [Candidatus Binatia bacterium]|jgi:hypothetical protein
MINLKKKIRGQEPPNQIIKSLKSPNQQSQAAAHRTDVSSGDAGLIAAADVANEEVHEPRVDRKGRDRSRRPIAGRRCATTCSKRDIRATSASRGLMESRIDRRVDHLRVDDTRKFLVVRNPPIAVPSETTGSTAANIVQRI